MHPCNNQSVAKRTTKRIINSNLIKEWLDQHAPKAMEKLAAGCNYGFTVDAVKKWLQKGTAPNLRNRTRIVKFTGLSMDRLFPEVPNRNP